MSRGHGRAQRFLLAEITEPGRAYHSGDPLRGKYAVEAGCSVASGEAALRRAARRLADEGRLDAWHARGVTWFGLPGSRWRAAERDHEWSSSMRRAFGRDPGTVLESLPPVHRPSASYPGARVDTLIRELLDDDNAVATVASVAGHVGTQWTGDHQGLTDMVRRRVRAMPDVSTYSARTFGCGCLIVYGDARMRRCDADHGRPCLIITRTTLDRFDRHRLSCGRHESKRANRTHR